MIADERTGVRGPDALAGPGDYLLMNGRAAFVHSRGLERINQCIHYY